MNAPHDETRHNAFCAWLDEAEDLFRKNPSAAYARLRRLADENFQSNGGKYGPKNPEFDAFDTAATDYGNGAL